MKTYSVNEQFGIWDLSGRNLFFKFPNFSIILSDDIENLDPTVIPLPYSELTQRDDLMSELLKSEVKKIYVDISSNTDDKLLEIILTLPSQLLLRGRYIEAEVMDSAPTVELFKEIFLGVSNEPRFYRDKLREIIKSNKALKTYSSKKPSQFFY